MEIEAKELIVKGKLTLNQKEIEMLEIIQEQDRFIKQRDSIISKLKMKEWFQDTSNLNLETPAILSSSIPVRDKLNIKCNWTGFENRCTWKSSELRRILAPIIPDNISISKWKPGNDTGIIIGTWAENKTEYKLVVPYQLQTILIILQNLLPDILDVIENNLNKE